ncbi:rRNA maturation RNase YbeY [Oceanibacterium hippocampi]|uniref:Endoribonuclease YbeY n=1 Tax=Oceanibacterium hippocampi TaxID=745714 RepID=A0A1Y5RLG2_9PROT|nr:rRNA maturation RNase YbeY [Oceanibacterium hippocampi]SLN19279.1 Endoribonuclease YbeY [Oceanibacterium hippocampi]
MNAPEIAVSVSCETWRDVLPDGEAIVIRASSAALAEEGLAERRLELSVVLADDESVRTLNRHYRGKDKPTNVLSFEGDMRDDGADGTDIGDGDRPPLLLGDIIVALETILQEAQLQNKSPGDHLSHLVVHGVLHLLGYDHENDDDAELMETRERAILAGLGIADPYGSGPRDADLEG